MRIAFITYEYPTEIGLGGIGTYTSQVAKALFCKGVEVTVFCGTRRTDNYYRDEGVHIYSVRCDNPESFKYNVVDSFLKEYKKQAYDLIESPEIHANAEEIKKKLPNLPLVIRLHAPNYLVENLKKVYTPLIVKLRFFAGAIRRGKWDLGYWRKYNFKEDSDYRFLQLADAVVAPSYSMKHWVFSHWKIDDRAIAVIPNIFIPDKSFLQLKRPTYNKTIVFFGRLNVLKGLVCATKAMKMFLAENTDWKWKVIGDDGPSHILNVSMRQWMEEQLYCVKDRVEFIDGLEYSQLPSQLAYSDVAVLPSLFESFSYTCKEALAAGLPVIGSKFGGMVDLIEPGVTGVLVNPYSVKDLYKALNLLCKADNLNIFQQNARAQALLLDQELVDKYIGYYSTVIDINKTVQPS